MHQRTALNPGERDTVQILRKLLLRENEARARTAERLMGRRSDEVGVLHRARMRTTGHQTTDVSHVRNHHRPDLVGYLANPREVDEPRIGAGADHDHLRVVVSCQTLHFLVVDRLILLAHAVGHHLVEPAGEIERMAVRQVTAMGEVHSHERIAQVENREINRHIGLSPAVRLHVGVLGAEELFRALDGQPLHDVCKLAASVITAAGITLCILVGEYRTGGFQNRFAREVLGSDELQSFRLSAYFLIDSLGDLGIHFEERALYLKTHDCSSGRT